MRPEDAYFEAWLARQTQAVRDKWATPVTSTLQLTARQGVFEQVCEEFYRERDAKLNPSNSVGLEQGELWG